MTFGKGLVQLIAAPFRSRPLYPMEKIQIFQCWRTEVALLERFKCPKTFKFGPSFW